MIALALFTVLANGVVHVPAAHWSAIEVKVPQNGTTVDCSFEVVEGRRVQAILLDREQAERFHRGRTVKPLYASGFTDAGRFREQVVDAGDYVLLLDNRIDEKRAAQVQVRIELLHPHSVQVRTASAQTKRTVVTASLLFFGAVLVLSARQYLKSA